MRAVALTEIGSAPEVHELAVPEPAEGEVRVRVRAASVNGWDVAVANRYLQSVMEHRFPVVLGKDFAGTIDAVGAGVTGFAPGDPVFGVVSRSYVGDGSFGQFVTVPTSVGITGLPGDVDFVEAAALGLAGTAALSAIDAANPKPGQTLLVVGATGGVGNQAVQLAAQAGAHVIATAHSVEERQLVTELGAAEVADYSEDLASQVFGAHPGGVHAVVHLAGDPGAVLPLVATGGLFISTLLSSPDQLSVADATVVPIFANPTPETLDRAVENHSKGRTRLTVQRVYRLEEAPVAIADFANGTLGKLVVVID